MSHFGISSDDDVFSLYLLAFASYIALALMSYYIPLYSLMLIVLQNCRSSFCRENFDTIEFNRQQLSKLLIFFYINTLNF